MDEKIYNILLFSFSFMLLFTGLKTCKMVEQTVLNSYINNTKDITVNQLSMAIYQSSFLVGNVYVFYAWQGITDIGDSQRIPLYVGLTLTTISACGVIFMAFLKSTNSTKHLKKEPEILEFDKIEEKSKKSKECLKKGPATTEFDENEEKPLIGQNKKTHEECSAFKKSLSLLNK